LRKFNFMLGFSKIHFLKLFSVSMSVFCKVLSERMFLKYTSRYFICIHIYAYIIFVISFLRLYFY
jgi:hypothetical protein